MKIKLTFILLAIYTSTQAQILKVDKGNSLSADSSGYLIGNIDFNVNLNNKSATAEENITFTGFQATADLVYVGENHAYILINTINYFKSTGGPLLSTGYTHGRINLMRRQRLSYEVFSQIQYDDGRMMPYRLLTGGGVRLRVSEKEKLKLHIGIGGMFEKERWRSFAETGKIVEKNIWKTSDYISGKFIINEAVDFDIITYYQGGYDSDADVFRNRISGEAALSVKLTERFSFITRFSAQYEDKPIIPINGFVYALTNGFKWDF